MRHCLFLIAAAATAMACASIAPAPASDAGTVSVQILAINDFHGNLEPPAGTSGRVGDIDAGGIEHLGAHIARLESANPHTVVVSAGDNIGASPFLSGMFHDEPSIEALGAIGLDISTVGNHEFDEGTSELIRMQRGGCHPVDGCQDGSPFAGAAFEFLSANVRVRSTGKTLFPASTVRTFDGVAVGFIGLALEGTASMVVPRGVADLEFVGEVEAANAAAADLRRRGVNTIVVLIHEGVRWPPTGPADCTNVAGRIVPIVQGLADDIAVVVSGHSHEPYTCDIDGTLVTSAYSYGRLVTDIDIVIDRASGRVISKTAVNVPVTREIRDARGTAIMERYRPFALEIGRRQVGTIAVDLTRVPDDAGETSLGSVVADAMLDATRAPAQGGAQIAFMNRAGLRTDLVRGDDVPRGTPAPVTFADVFSMMPFGNTIIVKTLTGDAIVALLEQQFDTFGAGRHNILQVSRGFSYAYDPQRARGSRIDRASLRLDGQAVEPSGRYRVAMSDFLWGGGERFTAAASGTDPVATGVEIDMFLDYLSRHSPLGPASTGRVRILR
jgi:5'-nucleotidase